MSYMDPDDFDFYLDQLITMRNLTVDVEARGHWYDALKSLEVPVFKEGVRRMIEEDEAYPSPAHVRKVCSDIMRERLSRAVQPPPPSGLTQDEYTRWEREWQRQVVRGVSSERAKVAAVEASKGHAQVAGSSPAGGERVIEGSVVRRDG